MKLRTRQIVLVIVLLTFVGIVQACTGSSTPQVNSQTTTKEAPPATQVFEVSSLTINPPETNPGVQVIVTAKVTNTGGTGEDYYVKLRIDDLTRASLPAFRYSEEVTIAASETQLLSVLFTMEKPGTYKVTWGELTEEFMVVQADKTDAGNYNAATKVTTPDFTSVDVMTNQKITLSQFKGSVVLLNFVNYGCDPLINKVVSKQLLTIRELQNQRSDFVPVSVFCGCCPPEVLRDFAEQNDLAWPWILDTDYSIVRDYASYLREYGYPTLIFIDQEQYIREVAGYSDLAALSDKLDQIMGESN